MYGKFHPFLLSRLLYIKSSPNLSGTLRVSSVTESPVISLVIGKLVVET